MAIKASTSITLSTIVDVKATYRYYLLQSSTLVTPSKPTTFPPSSSWKSVEPTYTDGSTNSLYFVDCTVFCDDTFQYSSVSLSTSYEAAKVAYNKAASAQETANGAIASTVEQFYLSSSPTSLSGGSWGNTQPTWTEGKYIWRRTLVTYGNGDTEYTPSENGVCITGNTGATGAAGSSIWTTTTAPTTPNYTFTISNLTGGNGTAIKVGDVIKYSYYMYTVTSVSSTTVLAPTRVSIRGSTGASGKWYAGTAITGTSTTATIFSGSGISSAIVGDMYLNTSTSNTYRCTTAGAASAAKWVYVANIQGEQGADGQMLYATCGTAAGTAAKVATLSSGTLTLAAGATVAVKFTYANTVSTPTLNVASTGAKQIRLNGAALTSTRYYWSAGAVITFVYDGSYWNVADANSLIKAAEASTQATNYLNFSNSGLVVGDMTASTLGNNVKISGEGIEIRNGDDTLASFESNIIELGKNNEDTSIVMCNGRASITGETEYGGMELDSKYIGMNTEHGVYLKSLITFPGSEETSETVIDVSPAFISIRQTDLLNDGDGLGAGTIVADSEIHLSTYNITINNANYIELDTPTVSMTGDLGVRGDIDTLGSITLENTKAIYGKNTSGATRNLLHINGSNQIAVGYGSYNSSEGETFLYGNKVNLYHKAGMTINGNALADFIVEQGTSGIWTYRKWNSGVAECWGRYTASNIASTTKWGNIYYGTIPAINFPSGLFNAAPITNCECENSNGWVIHNAPTATAFPSSYLCTAKSITTTPYLSIRAIGKWK